MDRLKEYLNQLFAGAGETPEVLYAKAELLQMMEDKYEALLEEGKTEDEAVDTIIAEFGNFEEISKELGIDDVIDKNNIPTNNGSVMTDAKGKERTILRMTKDQILNYTKFAKKHAGLVAGGIAAFILAPFFASICDDLFEGFIGHAVAGALSGLAFFLFIAIGVSSMIIAANLTKRSGRLNKHAIILDADAIEDLDAYANKVNSRQVIMLVIGIAFCILAPAASALGDLMVGPLGIIFDSGVLLFAAIGVFFIVYSSSIKNRLEELDKGIKHYDSVGYAKVGGTAAGMAGSPAGNETNGNATATWNYEPKSHVPVWVIIVVIVFCSITLGTVFTCVPFFSGYHENFFAGGQQFDGNEKFPASQVNNIKFDIASSNVNLNKGSGSDITIAYHGKFMNQPKVSLENGELKVKINDSKFHLFGAGNTSGTIDINIPETCISDYKFEMAAGNLNINEIKMNSLDAELAAGDFSFNNGSIANRAKFEMAAGNLTINGTEVKDLDAELAAGNFEYHFKDKNDADNFRFDLNCALGELNFFGATHGGIVSQSAKNGGGSKSMKVEAAAGRINVD